MKDFDVLTIGDAIIDIFLHMLHDSEDFQIDRKNYELKLRLGAKIPVDDSAISLGGDACNVTVGVSRLGLRSAIMAEIGDDDLAEKIMHKLTQERINQDFLIQTKGASSTFSVVLSITDERIIFSRHMQREHHFSFTDFSTEWIYLTSLGKMWRHAYRETITYVKKNHVKLAFSPGSHQLKEGVASFADVLPITDMLFVNREEGEKIAYGHEHKPGESEETIEKLLKDLQQLGPKIVSVTDGLQGSFAIDSEGRLYQQGIKDSQVVEKTGVGDAYAAGFLAAIIHRKTIQEAMNWGATNSAAVIEHIGGVTGLLTHKQMMEKISNI